LQETISGREDGGSIKAVGIDCLCRRPANSQGLGERLEEFYYPENGKC
jgi:hypothetical protein